MYESSILVRVTSILKHIGRWAFYHYAIWSILLLIHYCFLYNTTCRWRKHNLTIAKLVSCITFLFPATFANCRLKHVMCSCKMPEKINSKRPRKEHTYMHRPHDGPHDVTLIVSYGWVCTFKGHMTINLTSLKAPRRGNAHISQINLTTTFTAHIRIIMCCFMAHTHNLQCPRPVVH